MRIAPHLGPLKRASGRLPHPLGDIEVKIARTGEHSAQVEVTLPPGLTGVFDWSGREVRLHAGAQEFDVK